MCSRIPLRLHPGYLLGLFSLLTFIGSLIAVPWLIGRMQTEFFHRADNEPLRERTRRLPTCATSAT